MAEDGGAPKVKAAMGKASNFFWDWGIPLTALGVGYFIGDFFGLTGVLESIDKNNFIGNSLPVKAPYLLLASGIYLSVGLFLWKIIGGIVGKSVGFALLGIAIKGVLAAI